MARREAQTAIPHDLADSASHGSRALRDLSLMDTPLRPYRELRSSPRGDALREGDEVVLHLSLWECIVAMHGDVRVPVASVGSARVVEDPAAERKQFASLGNGMPWLLAYGVRDIYGVGKGFIATRGRRPAVLVHLTPPSQFVRLLVSVADPQVAASAMTSAARRRH